MASRSSKQMRYAQPMTPVSSSPKTPPKSSIASAVRSVVSSRKPAQTSARLGRPIANVTVDRNGNRNQRATLGPADPATRRAALNAALRPGPPVKKPMPVKTAQPMLGEGGMGGKRRSQAIDDQATRFQR